MTQAGTDPLYPLYWLLSPPSPSSSADRLRFAVYLDDELVGRLQVSADPVTPANWWLAIELSPAHVGAGYGRRALAQLPALLPAEVRELHLYVACINGRALRCYVAAGFVWLPDEQYALLTPEQSTLAGRAADYGSKPCLRFYRLVWVLSRS